MVAKITEIIDDELSRAGEADETVLNWGHG